jgi:acrylyl-CoA reductase (NADPH)
MSKFRAIVVEKTSSGQRAGIREIDDSELDGDVAVRVTHSSVNYKDALALDGRAPIVRRFPLVAGIDFAGEVMESGHPDFKPGDTVVLTGWGAGESRHGGFAERARWPGEQLVKLPQGLTAEQAMAIGTAGLTAMLCVLALERYGLKPEGGPAIVTGATGGVGSIAIALLVRKGWEVLASTGHPEETPYLKKLGASQIVARSELEAAPKALGKETWAAGIDTVGSTTLANLCARTKYGGAIAACGLAGGMDLPASVAPFILRNVALLGVDSVQSPMAYRQQAWQRLGADLDPDLLESMTTRVRLEDVMAAAQELLTGSVRGRIVVNLA